MAVVRAPIGAEVGQIVLDRENRPVAVNLGADWQKYFIATDRELNRLAALVDESDVGDFTSLKIGGVEVISSGRNILNVGSVTASGAGDFTSLKVGGTEVVDGSRNVNAQTLNVTGFVGAVINNAGVANFFNLSIGGSLFINSSKKYVLPMLTTHASVSIGVGGIGNFVTINAVTGEYTVDGVTVITNARSGQFTSLFVGGSQIVSGAGLVNGKLQTNGWWLLPFVNSAGGTHIDTGGGCNFSGFKHNGTPGVSGSFQSGDATPKTITVTGGIITGIA